MARPKKSEAPDLAVRVNLTVGAIDRLTCPTGKKQAFMRDSEAPGLRVRVTPATAQNPKGVKAFVFEAKLNRQTIRRTIGDVRAWSIEAARNEAHQLRVTLDSGTDPREVERQQQADKAVKASAAAAHAVTVGEVWAVYLKARRLHWGDRHYTEHLLLVKPGGVASNRAAGGVTAPGILHSLMALPLRDLTAPVIESWAARETQTRPAAARLAWRCLKAFLSWCSEQPEYAPALQSANPAKTKKARESLGKSGVKQDALLKEQLPAWFDAVGQLQNPVIAAYLQTLLLTGARAGEVLGLRWDDINTKWRGLTIRDKVEGTRVIPFTPYVAHLLVALPRRNEFVFSSTIAAGGTVVIPRNPHHDACKVAGIDDLTIHGLRRSFKSLTEWLEIPAGVVAQIMGHKPSATAEKHYTVRPLDLLRIHHEKIEAWILEQAGIVFDAKVAPGKLRVAS
ncbi:integrase family protein [Polaromonas sp.]|uniref:tyrosine-type recombinase/integrase n=1 Tax=Polaromonas sp. TaxID=1869339 RepID=UPI0017DD41B4|nr:integrase family protein [Polaromonas sp.]NMM05983.1 integrase family protein [Polaromonas sp.]